MNRFRDNRGNNRQFRNPSLQTTSFKLESSNRLLAGYMAHEFLTKGTIMGQKFNPETDLTNESKKKKMRRTNSTSSSSSSEGRAGIGGSAEASAKSFDGPIEQNQIQSYTAVARLLKTEGTHIPEVVNPAQLSSWIRI